MRLYIWVYGELTIAPIGWVAMMRKYRWYKPYESGDGSQDWPQCC
jgi:hypothetical protein